MCMKSTPEGCELRDELKETKAAVAALGIDDETKERILAASVDEEVG